MIQAFQLLSDFQGDHLSTRMLAVKGDGVTDDTAALQTALNYASTNQRPLYLPDGVYLFTSLTVNSDTHVYGAGRNRSILQHTGTGTALSIIGGDSVAGLKQNIHFRDMTFLGQWDKHAPTAHNTTIGLDIGYAMRCEFRGVEFRGFGLHGLRIGASFIIDFFGCQILTNGGDGVFIDQSYLSPTFFVNQDNNAIRFFGGQIEENFGRGIRSIGGRCNTWKGVTVEGNHGEGFLFIDPYGAQVDGCYVEQNGIWGDSTYGVLPGRAWTGPHGESFGANPQLRVQVSGALPQFNPGGVTIKDGVWFGYTAGQEDTIVIEGGEGIEIDGIYAEYSIGYTVRLKAPARLVNLRGIRSRDYAGRLVTESGFDQSQLVDMDA